MYKDRESGSMTHFRYCETFSRKKYLNIFFDEFCGQHAGTVQIIITSVVNYDTCE